MELIGINRVTFNRGVLSIIKSSIDNILSKRMKYSVGYSCTVNKKGIYVIIKLDYKKHTSSIEYIGSSKNIFNRLHKGHHHVYDDLIDEKKNSDFSKDIIVLTFSDEEYLKDEKKLIKSLRPNLNKVHNG